MNATFEESTSRTSFELREQDNVLVLELAGEFGSLGWEPGDEDLESAVLSAFANVPSPRMAIDLSGVTYAGSEFVGFLLGLWKRLQALGGRMVLTGVQENVSEVLRTLNLDRILPSYPSTDEAIAVINDG